MHTSLVHPLSLNQAKSIMIDLLHSRFFRRGALLLTAAALPLLAAAEWRSLFNGEDLSGWERVNGSAPYTVLDGAIVGTTVTGSPNSFLATTETFDDFVLELEFKQTGGHSNSGVQFRSNQDPQRNGRVYGYQSEIDPSERRFTAGIYDEAGRGWLYPVSLNPRAQTLYQYGRWNHLRIEAIGDSLRTWLNGVPVAHLIDDASPSGFIALQVHSIRGPQLADRRIHWRNIRINTNPQKAPVDDIFIRNLIPNHLSEAEAQQGWRLLWDGETTDGWRGVYREDFPPKGWSIEDGAMVVAETGGGEARAGGDIVTEEQFSAFDLQVDFWMAKAANSGIKYFVTGGYRKGGGGGSAIGLEYQILDDQNHPDRDGGVAGNHTLASLYDMFPSRKVVSSNTVPRSAEQWNHARIVVRPDNHAEHWLNGFKVLEYERGSPSFLAMVQRSKYAKWEGFGTWEEGRILLQDHGNVVRFRSIKIRELEE